MLKEIALILQLHHLFSQENKSIKLSLSMENDYYNV